MTRSFRILGMMLAAGACILATSPAFATPVSLPAPSTNVAVPQSDSFATDVGSYTVLDTYSSTVTNGSSTSVTLYADAIQTSGGSIYLLYQLTNAASSPGPIDSLSLTNFSNIPGVAVAGLSDTSIAGTNFVTPTSPPNAPNSANRNSAPGSNITFTFSSTPGQDLQAGQTSAIILVETTAKFWDTSGTTTASSLAVSAGSVAFNAVPEATLGPNAVPEPGSLVLGSLALISGAGVYGFRRLLRK